MQRTMDRILRKILDFINKYETVRWKISSIIANKILNLLTFLEKQSKKGIILRRVQLRLKEKYQPGVPIPGKNFREIEGVESAFIGAFHYRLYPYSKVILVLFAIVVIDYFSNCSINVVDARLYGSLFTFSGTIIFARGLFRGLRGLQRAASEFDHTSNYDILDDIPDRVNWNELVSLSYSSADAVWATIFVTIGFGFNLVARFPISTSIPC